MAWELFLNENSKYAYQFSADDYFETQLQHYKEHISMVCMVYPL